MMKPKYAMTGDIIPVTNYTLTLGKSEKKGDKVYCMMVTEGYKDEDNVFSAQVFMMGIGLVDVEWDDTMEEWSVMDGFASGTGIATKKSDYEKLGQIVT